VLNSEWAPVVAAVAVTVVLGVAAVILRRIRPSRLRATGGVAVPSWPAVREASSALTERDLRGLRAEFRVGTAGSGIAVNSSPVRPETLSKNSILCQTGSSSTH
jgi:hypothetical protein